MRFLISLSDQVLAALLTFIVNLWMARKGQPAAYGVYALWLAVAWISGTAQSTLVTSHLAGLNANGDEERQTAERFFLTTHIVVVLTALALTAATNALLAYDGSPFYSVSSILFIPFFLVYQYTRALLFAHHRADYASALTGTTLILFVGAAWICSSQNYAPTPNIGLALAGCAYGLGALGWLLCFTRGQRPLLHWHAIRPHFHYIRSTGWILLGTGSAELTNRLFSFVGAGRYGASAVAILTATQVAIRPAWMLSAAWASVSLPQLSRLWGQKDRKRFLAVLGAGLFLPLLGSILWTGAVELGWPKLSQLLYKGQYQQSGPLLLLWGANVILGSVGAVGSTAMLAMKRYRSLAIIDALAALTTCSCMALVSMGSHYSLVIVGTLAGQAVQCLCLARHIRRIFQKPPSPAQTSVRPTTNRQTEV